MATGWYNWSYDSNTDNYTKTDRSTVRSGGLIDTLARAGGYVLPFTYAARPSGGAVMSGTSTNASFKAPSYTSDDVANNDPRYDEPPILDAEVASIHRVFPSVPVVVIGHSNGGLIAEQWWVRYKPTDIAHIFSLDSPINGVDRAGPLCQLGLCGRFGVGATTANAYVSLWQDSASDQTDGNAALLALDGQNHLYTASGTYGDPLYDAGDAVFRSPPHNGILSQLILDPHCLASKDATSPSCTPVTPFDFVQPCGPSQKSPADSQYHNITYGMTGSLWIHSQAKNCAGTVSMIMSYISSLTSPSPPQSSPSPSQSSQATPSPAQATVVKTFEPWVAAGQNGGSAPRPGLMVTNGGTGTCDSGSADDPGAAVAVRCTPPGNGTPCYINDIGGGPGSPLLCSSDPTSNQVIEVTPSGGIPAGMLNPGDPSQPPWFLILADGRKCHLLGYGTNTNVLSYDCGNNIGATMPDRSQPTWTVQEGQLQANPAPSPARVAVVTAYRGKTAVATPPASPTPAPATTSSATAVVQDYYAAINKHDYQEAWSLGGKNLSGSYDSFVQGFANTAHDSITVASLAGNTVIILIDSTQTDGTHEYFTGSYTVQNNEIASADVRAR